MTYKSNPCARVITQFANEKYNVELECSIG